MMIRQRQRKRRVRALAAAWVGIARNANEARDIEIVHQPIYVRGLPEEFDGYMIVQLSDIHHDVHNGSFADGDHIGAAVDIVNQIQPDLAVLTGDYVTYSGAYIEPCAEILAEMQPPDGSFAVLGNHDFWTGADGIARVLEQQGLGVLRNTHTHLRQGGESLALVGVDDPTMRRDDLRAALRGVRPGTPTILLAHNPRLIRQAARSGIDLMLSGHTHGGQIRFPTRTRRERRWRRFLQGHRRVGPTQIYVNRGLGTVIVPVRYQCPPEITVIELKRCPPGQSLRWFTDRSKDDDAVIYPR